jgi:hypothetical protein
MNRIWAVAKNTIRQALRMKAAGVFILLLLVILPILGLTATGDGTLKGRLQTFVSYGMSLTSLLLCFLTIIVSIYAITSDIDHRQIYTVITKPLRRHEFVLGKLLGVIVLDVALLTLFSGLIYGVVRYIPRLTNADPEAIQQVENEFYTARASLVPPEVDVSEQVRAIYQEKKEQLDEIYSSLSYDEIIKELTYLERLKRQAVSVGEQKVWEFENVKPLNPNESLFVRFKYDVSVTPPDEQVYGDWLIGDLRELQYGPESTAPIYRVQRKDAVRTFREIQVPADAVADDGYLAVGFANPPLNQTVVLFPTEDGLEVLYKADTFTGNFVRGSVIILCRLVFLASLGTLAGSFLSFPVAILFCLVIFLTGTVSGFIVDSFDTLSRNIGIIYTYTIKGLVQLLPQFDKYNPTEYLVPARLMTWGLLARVIGVMVCIKAALLLALALVVFSFRELAKIVV